MLDIVKSQENTFKSLSDLLISIKIKSKIYSINNKSSYNIKFNFWIKNKVLGERFIALLKFLNKIC